MIEPEDLEVQKIPRGTEFLILKTGCGATRQNEIYWKENPIFRPEIAEVLRQQCPNLRVFGFDTISISSWQDRQTGRQAHKAFLDHGKPILLLEDLDLQLVNAHSLVNQITVCPLMVAGADGAPCTVLAELV